MLKSGMYDFILQTIVMVSLGVIIYLFARAIPRVSEASVSVPKRDYVGEVLKKIPFQKIDNLLNSVAAKLLRKSKIVVLKLDNWISSHLHKFKPANGNKETSKLLENPSEENKL